MAENYNNLGEYNRNRQMRAAVTYPAQLALGGVKRVVVGVVEATMPESQRFAEELEAQMPLHNFRVGQAAVKRAQKIGDPELLNMGEAMMLKAPSDAQKSDKVPPHVTRQVADNLVEHGLDADDAIENPFVSDEVATHAFHVVNNYGSLSNVTKINNL